MTRAPGAQSAPAQGTRRDDDAHRRGEQTGKRDAEERNDPAVQPGAREGKPDPERGKPGTPGR